MKIKLLFILLSYMLCEFTFYVSSDFVRFITYLLGLAVIGVGYYTIMRFTVIILGGLFKNVKK